MSKPIRILGIAGSLRSQSYNRAALRAATQLAPEGATIDIFELDGIPPFSQDHEQEPPTNVTELKRRIRESDAVLFVTPEYNYSIPGVLKNAIDWASRPYGDNAWWGKPAAMMGASIGAIGTARAQYHLRQVMVFLNMFPVNEPEVMIRNAQGRFDAEGNLTDEATRKYVRRLLQSLVDWTQRIGRQEQPAPTHTSSKDASAVSTKFGDRRQEFRRLHKEGCFVIPNPWDVGSARYLQHLGFSALATTSAGFAFSQGLPDSDIAVSRDRSLAHIAEIAAAVDLPVNADYASGYGVGPKEVADSVRRCVATGVAGLSIEDGTGDPSAPLYELPAAIERVKAAREAIDQATSDVLLTARAECYLVGHEDALRESARRLQAYAEAGADVLFAPGVSKPEQIKALVEAVQPKPLNLLVFHDSGLSVSDIAALGVRRISVGGAFALAAWGGFMRAAQTLKSDGSFAGLTDSAAYVDVNDFLAADLRNRGGLAKAKAN